eukprot:c2130_g1_i1.p1 GENE.c2130_g1_i1~~c2130_g1_i1.p1  ORF type:complete len:183 (-),score=31.28 c2130_g1_i1:430-978(-)
MQNRQSVIDLTSDDNEDTCDLTSEDDHLLAMQLQLLEDEGFEPAKPVVKRRGDSDLEEIVTVAGQVHPDIIRLFILCDSKFFEQKLSNSAVTVEWSSRMTLCAGLCQYHPLTGCRIKLSKPLLQFRENSDILDTLLHEMIHAFLFVSKNNRDHDDHGPQVLYSSRKFITSILTYFRFSFNRT